MHFENLWSDAENSFQQELSDSAEEILQRIIVKLNILSSLDKKELSSKEEVGKTKEHLIGEILLDFTHLSAKENINVYKALQDSLHYRKMSLLIEKNSQES